MTTITKQLENRITAIFRERDPLMENFDTNRVRILALEARAGHAQLELAKLVEGTDPKRAARLRGMAKTLRENATA